MKDDNSGEAQVRQWKRVVDSWERYGGNQDVVVMGDMNLDFKQWHTLDGYEGEMKEDMDNMVVMLGFSQEIEGITHMAGGRGMTIDHIWSNCPRRTVETGVHFNRDSDYNII